MKSVKREFKLLIKIFCETAKMVIVGGDGHVRILQLNETYSDKLESRCPVKSRIVSVCKSLKKFYYNFEYILLDLLASRGRTVACS